MPTAIAPDQHQQASQYAAGFFMHLRNEKPRTMPGL
jgi:hypothetical protein